MPELPEVEIIQRGLNKLLPGKRIVSVTHDMSKSFPNAPRDVEQFLVGARVIDVKRRAKVLIIELDSNYSLVIHLKMTGQLVYVHKRESSVLSLPAHSSLSLRAYPSESTGRQGPQSLAKTRDKRQVTGDLAPEERFGAGHPSDSLVGELPDKSTRVIFSLDNNAQLFFNDQRKFGWVRLIPTTELPNIDFFKKIGPEPLDTDFTAKAFRDRLMKRPSTSIKAALLDQSVIAGVGNIYADESLWGARIHPTTLVKSISAQKLKRLYEELRYVLKLSIEKGGSTDRNYVNAEGKRGSYLSFARVFRREGQTCPRCGTTVLKLRVAGRGTHICPKCQRIKKARP